MGFLGRECTGLGIVGHYRSSYFLIARSSLISFFLKSLHLANLARKFPIVFAVAVWERFGDLLNLVLTFSLKVNFPLVRRNLFYFSGGFFIFFVLFRHLTKYIYIYRRSEIGKVIRGWDGEGILYFF